jgi:hypothetical protein
MKRRAAICAALAAVLTLGGCAARETQRWPGPMRATQSPLPPGDAQNHPAGPEEVSVLRHADPVQVRPAGALRGYPLSFFDKRARLTAGGAVVLSPGGRAEVLWPDGASVMVAGETIGWVGSPSRGEPLFEFQELDRARIELREGAEVRLLGGAILSGASGPYLLHHDADETLAIQNQSKAPLSISFREERIELAPGQTLKVPLLSSGGAPFGEDAEFARFQGPGFALRMVGEPACTEVGERVEIQAAAERDADIRTFGVRVKLPAGERATFSLLSGAGR